jgi:S-adenosylmethionine decarboxylase proenzyme
MIELWGCERLVIDDPARVRQAMLDAVAASGCTLLEECAHRFSPQGVTIVGLLAESHISVHTWPEHGYVAGDVFTCGDTTDARAACMALVESLGAARWELRTVARGAPGGLQRDLPGTSA